MPGKRKSIRLMGYDYAQEGAYYVTICVGKRTCRGGSRAALIKPNHNVFGHIENGKMILNDIGKIIHDSWLWLANQYNYIDLDEFIVMPNHLHGIVFLTGVIGHGQGQGASRGAPTTLRKPLGQLIGAFKTVSTKQINIIRNIPGNRLWQRNFYEHIIRNESDLNRIREYIINNPANWKKDSYYFE
ncbi:MAG: transposase [Candidatus Omnitrophica bacterium]|nr:transposase [Candidatus Omnitrophota bacterium]